MEVHFLEIIFATISLTDLFFVMHIRGFVESQIVHQFPTMWLARVVVKVTKGFFGSKCSG